MEKFNITDEERGAFALLGRDADSDVQAFINNMVNEAGRRQAAPTIEKALSLSADGKAQVAKLVGELAAKEAAASK
jgi:hypothetical protein